MELYYYTTTNTMQYILTKGDIYATNMMYMNDSEEFINGLRELRELMQSQDSPYKKEARAELTDEKYESRRSGEINSFSISFTKRRDLLSQWSMYAKESGISLKMNFKNGKYAFYTYSKEEKEQNVNYKLMPKPVFYCTHEAMKNEEYKKEKIQILNALSQECQEQNYTDIEDSIEDLWLRMSPYVKRYDFLAEEEYRLVFDFKNAIWRTPRVDFRNDKNVLKPYLDISIEKGWPVREIIVGPGFNQDAVFRSVLFFLKNSNIMIPVFTVEEFNHNIKAYTDELQRYNFEKKYLQDNILKMWKQISVKCVKPKEKQQDIIKNLFSEFEKLMHDVETKMTSIQKDNLRRHGTDNQILSSGLYIKKSRIPYIF